MNPLTRFTQVYTKQINALKWVVKEKILTIQTNNLSGLRFRCMDWEDKRSSLSEQEKEMCRKMLKIGTQNMPDCIEYYVVGKIFESGPKIFRPRIFDLEMCEQIELNIPINDYVQPFPTIVIELPEDYLDKKRVINPLNGEVMYGKPQPAKHHPEFIAMHHDKISGCILTLIHFSSDTSVKSSFVGVVDPTTGESKLLEKYFESLKTKPDFSETQGYYDSRKNTFEFRDSLETSLEEWVIIEQLNRAALNYCLLLDEIGVKRLGPQNPDEYARLQRYQKVARKEKNREDKIYKADNNVQNHAQLYALNQEVVLARVVNETKDLDSESTGRIVSPHHRRGYYRQQRYGQGNTLIKRIRINPVFVNKHLFLEDMDKTKVIYS